MTWIETDMYTFLCLETGVRIEKCQGDIILKKSEYDNEPSDVYEPSVRIDITNRGLIDDAWNQLRTMLNVQKLTEDKDKY